ncbi:MAG: hypothetical protein KF799_09530 [Bdellovibrionales bacterium]|nr:hypothetical protein [Bdellovibrionales bacterium]
MARVVAALLLTLGSSAWANPPECENHLISHDAHAMVHWASADIGKLFHALNAADIPLGFTQIRTTHATIANEVLSRELGTNVKIDSFIYGVRKRYNSWDEGLRQNGFDPLQLRRRFPLSPEQIVNGIRALHAKGIALSASAMNLRTDDEPTRALLREACGVSVNSRSIYQRAKRQFGSWNQALKVAGIERVEVVQYDVHNFRSRENTLAKLRFLSQEIRDLRISNLIRQKLLVRLLLFSKFGEIDSARGLYNASIKEFGTWGEALAVAGVRRQDIPRREPKITWNQELIRSVLYELSHQKLNLDRPSFLSHESRVQILMENMIGHPVRARTIYRAALIHFGSWRQALDAAGVESHRPRRDRPTSDIVLIPHIVYWERRSDGTPQRIVEHGEPPPTPEDILGLAQIQGLVRGTVDKLTPRFRQLAQALLSYLDENDGLLAKEDVLKFANEISEFPFTWEDVQGVLTEMADSLRSMGFRL